VLAAVRGVEVGSLGLVGHVGVVRLAEASPPARWSPVDHRGTMLGRQGDPARLLGRPSSDGSWGERRREGRALVQRGPVGPVWAVVKELVFF
jgi:hypothetical protein